jgi:hypothetical protein
MAYKKLSESPADAADSTPISPLAANLVQNEAVPGAQSEWESLIVPSDAADIIQSGASSIQGVRKAARTIAAQLR